MDKAYWEQYYDKQHPLTESSDFAKYVLRNYFKTKDRVIELGCGNGRDAIYFANNNINIVAVDQCSSVNKFFNNTNTSQLKFECQDFTNLNDLGFFDGIYSRFTLHSITEDDENKVLRWCKKHLNPDGKLYIEARSTKNELFKKGLLVGTERNTYIYNNHKRRFLDKVILSEKLKTLGFRIIYLQEGKDFAPLKNENQTFMRIVAQKSDSRNFASLTKS